MIERMRQEVPAKDKPIVPKIENLILIDRRIDLMTMMSSQVTYEGLIDELYGIKNTQVHHHPVLFIQPTASILPCSTHAHCTQML